MWMLILIGSTWYAKEYAGENHLREELGSVFDHVNNGNVVSICDDLDTWCDEMEIHIDSVVVVED